MKINHTLKQVLVVTTLMIIALSWSALPAIAQGEENSGGGTEESSGGGDQGGKTYDIFSLPDPSAYGNIAAPAPGGTAQNKFAQLVYGIILNVRYIIGAVAIAMIVYAGLRMLLGNGKEDVYTQERRSILYGIIGLATVGLAGEIANIFQVACPEQLANLPKSPCTKGGFLSDPNALVRTALVFEQRTQIVITFLKYFIGSIAVIMIIRNGLRMVTMGASEDKMALDKKNLGYSILGLGLIIIADNAISKVLYKIDLSKYPGVEGATPEVDVARGVQEIAGFTNFVVSIVGPIAVLALLGGGVMYILAAGEEEKMNKAKRIITTALIGLIIIYGAFAVVSTIIGGQF